MKITHEQVFDSRVQLDAFIRNTFGDDSIRNKNIEIELSESEAAGLSLSNKVSVYGVKIKVIK